MIEWQISDCFNNKRYELSKSGTFDTSLSLCEELDGTLAQVSNTKDADIVFQILNNVTEPFFIGLKRSEDSDGFNPKSFKFLDGSSLSDEFGGLKDQFPWIVNQPDNSFETEFCVEANFGENGFWNDISCDTLSKGLCEFPCEIDVTLSPTTDKKEEDDDPIEDYEIVVILVVAVLVIVLILLFSFIFYKSDFMKRRRYRKKFEKSVVVREVRERD